MRPESSIETKCKQKVKIYDHKSQSNKTISVEDNSKRQSIRNSIYILLNTKVTYFFSMDPQQDTVRISKVYCTKKLSQHFYQELQY